MHGNSEYDFIRKVGDLSGDGVSVYDLRRRKFIYTNSVFLDIFQVNQNDLSSNPSLIIRHVATEDFAYLKSRYHELFENGSINTSEFRIRFSDGSLKHLSCDVMVLQDPGLITAFVKDITNSRRHEDYLIKYTAQKDIMLDMLTHNLSGPLQLSKDVIASIRQGYSENNLNHVSRLINIMQENTQQCIDIVNDFLKEEHYESSFTFVRKTRFDVIDKVNIMLAKLREINKDKNFTLTTELENLNISSDAVKFFQIIHNILSNSVKFTPPRGTIDIRVKDAQDTYEICISDNGIGIPDAIKPSIFQNRIPGRTGLKGEKSKGMGLAIASRLIQLMHGQIWFESMENKGTTFYIRLPKE